MYYDREEYEKLINESILFSLDKEKQSIAYRKEERKMVEYLYCYLMGTKKKEEYAKYGLEIVETALKCIEKYDSSKGKFLNFFSASWKNNYLHLYGREIIQAQHQGIRFTDEEERQYRLFQKLAQKNGMDVNSPEFIEKIMEVTGLDEEKINNIQMMINSQVSSSISVDDGDIINILDQVDSGKYVEDTILQFEATKEGMENLEIAFNHLQERQKPILAMLISSKISLLISEDEKLLNLAQKMSFFEEDVFKETMKRGEQLQAKEIAKRFDVSEASISRTWKNFVNKLEERNE